MTDTTREADSALEISVVIPCLNEEENVRNIHAAVKQELLTHAKTHEIIFIDNGSTDATRALMRQLVAEDDCTRAIFNTRNFGQMRSPTYGIYQAEGRAVIGMGADFQDPPSLIGPLIAEWRKGASIVLGVRRTEDASAMTTALRAFGYGWLQRNADYKIIPGATGFGLFDRKVVDTVAAWHEPEPFFRGMLIESGYPITQIPYDRPGRAAGETKNDLRALVDFALSSIAGSSKALLRRPIVWGFFIGLFAAGLGILAIVGGLLGMAGWPFILGAALQIGLFALTFSWLGLVGEQVRLLAERTRMMPLVLEEERIGFGPDRAAPSQRTHIGGPTALR